MEQESKGAKSVARIKNWGGQKWTSEVNDQQNIYGFIYVILKSRDYVL